jgi:hypothetical protein
MKKKANQHHSKLHFEEEDQGFLHLQPYMQTSLKDNHHDKLAPNFFGPYNILKRIGLMDYNLELPSHSKIHHVFHVPYLKKMVGSN